MIFRVTNKLAKRIHVNPAPLPEEEVSPYIDWASNSFIANRSHYIVLMNSRTLLSTVLPAKGITNTKKFAAEALRSIETILEYYSFDQVFKTQIEPASNNVMFTKVANPKLNGYMVDLVHHARDHICNGLSTLVTATRLNQIPQLKMEEAFPIEAFKKLG